MSRLVFMRILDEALSRAGSEAILTDSETDQLYQEILYYFGLVGGSNVCEALEAAWQDPYIRNEIREFILAWLRKKTKKREKAATGVI